MKYIYQEPIITTISDNEISDVAEIKKLFVSLKEMQHGFFMEFEDVDNPDFVRSFDNVRITDVRETDIDLHVFLDNASMRFKKLPFLNIRRVRILAGKQSMAKKYKITRWHMMDVAEIE